MLSSSQNEVLFRGSTVVRAGKLSPEEQFAELCALFQKGVWEQLSFEIALLLGITSSSENCQGILSFPDVYEKRD